MEKTLILIGAGGHGAEVAAFMQDLGLPLAGAFDDGQPAGPWHVSRIIGGLDSLAAFCAPHSAVQFITAFGGNELRRRMVEKIEAMGIPNLSPLILRHAAAWMGPDCGVGHGTLLAPQSLVTTRASIGRHCIVNVKASISHDCVIGDWCNVNPGATLCGDVQLGEGCYIGAGATVIEKIKVGAWTTVGAGAVVTRDLPAGVTVVGVPARIIKQQGIPPAPRP